MKTKTTNLFELGWEHYDSWSQFLFIKEETTQEQFKADVHSLIIKYGDEYLQHHEKSWAGADGWIEFVAGKLPELGYTPVTPIREYFNASSIIENKKKDEEWYKIVGKKLFDKAVAHNKRIEENLFKEESEET